MQYAKQKGFCEDLDEGKYSLTLIHAMQAIPDEESMLLRSILTQRRMEGSLSYCHKSLVLEQMAKAGSMEFTVAALRKLQGEIDREVIGIALKCGTQNSSLQLLLELLRV